MASQFTLDHVTSGISLAQLYVYRSRDQELSHSRQFSPATIHQRIATTPKGYGAFVNSIPIHFWSRGSRHPIGSGICLLTWPRICPLPGSFCPPLSTNVSLQLTLGVLSCRTLKIIHQRIATTPREYGPSSIASQFTLDHVTTGILLARVYVYRSRDQEFAPRQFSCSPSHR